MYFKWEDGFSIKVSAENSCAVISANREGLISLANHLLTLSQEPAGGHIHLDSSNSLEDGSAELIIEKI